MLTSEQHNELLTVLDAMERYGGGFVSALARAWRKADGENQAKLRDAFDGYYQQYLATVKRRESVQVKAFQSGDGYGGERR
jgi:hypothetical protein